MATKMRGAIKYFPKLNTTLREREGEGDKRQSV